MNYRHGDLALIKVEELPQKLKLSTSKVLMIGSGGNNHSYNNGKFYPYKDAVVVGYFVAKNSKLFHIEHGRKVKGKKLREVKIKDDIYELRQQHEDTNDGMKPVID